jgi:head-tail adaptor
VSQGRKRERITFQRRAADANGDRTGDWVDDGVGDRMAEVLARRGTEPVMQARLQGVQPIEVKVDSDPGTRLVDAAWRIVWKGAPHNIRAIAPDQAGKEISMLAEADQSDA